MLSRITGLMRDILFAKLVGAGVYADAYNMAFRLPNLLRRIFAEGAFSQAFVPILSEYKTEQSADATRLFLCLITTLLTWSLLLVCIVGVLGAPLLVAFLASGFIQEPLKYEATVMMTRIMFPYIGFISLVALAGGILNTWHKFKAAAFSPVLLNLTLILSAFFLSPYLSQPVYAFAIAVFIGGFLQLALQIPALKHLGMLPRISFSPLTAWRDAAVRRVLKNMVPPIFAVSAAQLSILINTNIASYLTTGSVSWLYYADRLMEFPTALLGVTLGTILLPSLSEASQSNDHHTFNGLLDWGLKLTFLLALPAAVGLATLSIPITAVLFHYGKFDTVALYQTSHALIAYGAGLIGLIVVKILAPGFYAKQNTRTPVNIAFLVLVVTQLMNILFVPFLAHVGLALSVGLGACVNALFLFILLKKKGLYTPEPGWGIFLCKQLCALILMGAVALYLSAPFDWIALQRTPYWRITYFSIILLACILTYFASLWIMGYRVHHFKRSLYHPSLTKEKS